MRSVPTDTFQTLVGSIVLTRHDLDMTSYFQDGGHDVRPLLAAAYAAAYCTAASAGCALARRARVTSLARSMRHSS